MKSKFAFLLLSFLCCKASQIFNTDIEPSDILYLDNLLYIVDDEGGFLKMNQNGLNQKYISVGDYDLESITNIPGDSNNIYLGVENPAAILKVNKLNGNIVEKKRLLAYPNDSDSGMESLQYVPKLDTFLAGSQASGYVYLYKNRIGNLKVHCRFKPYNGLTDLSAMTLKNEILYLLYDSGKTLLTFNLKTTTVSNMCQIGSKRNFIGKKIIGNSNQEGITFTSGYVFIAQDSGEIVKYSMSEFNNF